MKTNANKKKEEENYNFKPDTVFKHLFTSLSTETRIKLLNSIFNIHLEKDTEIVVVNTENIFKNLIDEKLESTRSDIILDVDHTRKIHIEFQSTKDDTMGLRVFLYGLALAKSKVDKKENILRFPLSHVLYMVPYGINKYGKDSIFLDVPNCTIENKYYEECKIQIDVNYTNLLSFSLDDFSSKNLESLSFIYLYRYLKNKEKVLQAKGLKTIFTEFDVITKILNTIPKADREELALPIIDMIQDISNIASQNQKNKELIHMLQEKVKTYAEVMIEELKENAEKQGIAKGMEKGIEETKLDDAKALMDILDDKTISEKLKLPMEKVKEIRDSYEQNHIAVKHKSHSQER